jgi:hypothetical protein
MEIKLFTLKLALLSFWAAWFAIVFLTNLFSGIKSAGVLPESWKFASKNYAAVAKATSLYQAPPWVPRLLFLGVVLWQLVAAALYGWAFASSLETRMVDWSAVNTAFAAGLGLWAAFMIADEITIKYAYEQSHEMLFIAQLVTLVALYLLPA